MSFLASGGFSGSRCGLAAMRVILYHMQPNRQSLGCATLEQADTARPPQRRSRMWATAAVVGVIGIAAASALAWRARTVVERAPLVVLLSDFENRTGEPRLDGTLEPLLTLALEGAPFVTSYDRIAARRQAQVLTPGLAFLNVVAAKLVVLREGIHVIVSGVVERADEGRYRLSIQALDAASGDTIESVSSEAGNSGALLGSVAKLSEELLGALGSAAPTSVQRTSAETFTSRSLDAAQSYSAAQGAAKQLQAGAGHRHVSARIAI